jgi:hypothetical protein
MCPFHSETVHLAAVREAAPEKNFSERSGCDSEGPCALKFVGRDFSTAFEFRVLITSTLRVTSRRRVTTCKPIHRFRPGPSRETAKVNGIAMFFNPMETAVRQKRKDQTFMNPARSAADDMLKQVCVDEAATCR